MFVPNILFYQYIWVGIEKILVASHQIYATFTVSSRKIIIINISLRLRIFYLEIKYASSFLFIITVLSINIEMSPWYKVVAGSYQLWMIALTTTEKEILFCTVKKMNKKRKLEHKISNVSNVQLFQGGPISLLLMLNNFFPSHNIKYLNWF